MLSLSEPSELSPVFSLTSGAHPGLSAALCLFPRPVRTEIYHTLTFSETHKDMQQHHPSIYANSESVVVLTFLNFLPTLNCYFFNQQIILTIF